MRPLIPLIALLIATPALAQDPTPTISVTGEGRVEAAPDMAQITLGVTTESETAAVALTLNSEATAAVMERLAGAGIESRDMQTSNLSLYPRRDERRIQETGLPPIVGFVANHMISVRVRDLSALGGILDAVVQDGANELQGLSFGLQDPSAAQDEARALAVADAMRKARLYAEAAGVELGDLLRLSENGGGPRPMMFEAQAMRADVPIAEGEVSITSSVSMDFEIDD